MLGFFDDNPSPWRDDIYGRILFDGEKPANETEHSAKREKDEDIVNELILKALTNLAPHWSNGNDAIVAGEIHILLSCTLYYLERYRTRTIPKGNYANAADRLRAEILDYVISIKKRSENIRIASCLPKLTTTHVMTIEPYALNLLVRAGLLSTSKAREIMTKSKYLPKIYDPKAIGGGSIKVPNYPKPGDNGKEQSGKEAGYR